MNPRLGASPAARAVTAFAAAALALSLPANAHARECGPIAAEQAALTDAAVPAGFRVSPKRAVAIARATDVVRQAKRGEQALVRLCETWQFSVTVKRGAEALVRIDGRTGRVTDAWGGYKARWSLARGSANLFVGRGTPLVMLALAVLFVAPFVDPRRPFRSVHADLAALLAVGLSLVPFRYGAIWLSTPLAWLGLAWLLVRMLQLAGRAADRTEPLVPRVSPRLLLAAGVVLMAGRGLFNALVGHANDVGYLSVFGAQSLLDGFPVYAETSANLDAYGPALHLAYVPFTLLFPLPGGLLRGGDEAAHAAAIGFDVLTAIALYALGRRLRPGGRGKALAAVLVFGWAANPLGFYPMATSTNDGLVGLFVVLALLTITSPAGRGVFAALGAAAKWTPAVLLPLMAAGPRRIERRGAEIFIAAVLVTLVAVTLPVLPDGGVREIYDVALGSFSSLDSPFSVWGLWGLPEWSRGLAMGCAAVLALAVAWVPRQRSVATVAALATAVLVATEMALPHWVHWYAGWFVPASLVAVFARHERVTA